MNDCSQSRCDGGIGRKLRTRAISIQRNLVAFRATRHDSETPQIFQTKAPRKTENCDKLTTKLGRDSLRKAAKTAPKRPIVIRSSHYPSPDLFLTPPLTSSRQAPHRASFPTARRSRLHFRSDALCAPRPGDGVSHCPDSFWKFDDSRRGDAWGVISDRPRLRKKAHGSI